MDLTSFFKPKKAKAAAKVAAPLKAATGSASSEPLSSASQPASEPAEVGKHSTVAPSRQPEAAEATAKATAPKVPSDFFKPRARRTSPVKASAHKPTATATEERSDEEPSSQSQGERLTTWCRKKYGADWHAVNKASRLAEARTALSGTAQCSVTVQSTSGASSSSPSTKRSAPDAIDAKQPKRASVEPVLLISGAGFTTGVVNEQKLMELLRGEGSMKRYMAILEVQRKWNMLDYSDETQFKMVGESMELVPVYWDDRERLDVLEYMQETMQDGFSSYENPFGADNTEVLLESFAQLSAPVQRRCHTIAEACVKNSVPIREDDILDLLGA